MIFAKRSKVCYSSTHMEATSPAEKTSRPLIKDVNPQKPVDNLRLAQTSREKKPSSGEKFITSQEKVLQFPAISFSILNKQLNEGQIEIAVVPTDNQTQNVVPSKYFRNEAQVRDAIVGAYGSAGQMMHDVPPKIYQVPLDNNQELENQAGAANYAIFEPVIGNEDTNTNPRYRAIALLVVRNVKLDQQRPEDLKMEGAKSTAANAYPSPEDLMEQMSRESKDADGNQDKRPEDSMDEWYPPVEPRSKGFDIISQPRAISRSEVAPIPTTEELQLGEMNEQDILSKLTVRQLEGLVKTGKLDNNALAYLATVIWEKYHRIGKAIQDEIEDEEGSDDDYTAINLLFAAHERVLSEVRSFSGETDSLTAEAEFWGLTPNVLERVLPGMDKRIAIATVVDRFNRRKEEFLKFALLDEVNAVISSRLVKIMDRELTSDDLTGLLATDSAGLNAFFDNFGKKPNGWQSIWATIRGRTIDAQPGSAIDFAQDLLKSIRKNFMPTLETTDDPTTVTIEGPQVPTEFEVNQFFSDNQQKAVDAVNALLEKYGNTFEIKDPEKVALAKHVLDQLKYLVYTPGNEGNNMIDYADKQLKALGLKTMYRPEPKQPKEQQAPSIFATEFWKDWGKTDDADSTLPKL